MQYEVYGPFQVPCSNRAINTNAKLMREFWKSCDMKVRKAVSEGIGVYVFSLRWDKKFVPWYVGKTTASFEREVFTPHKLGYYDDTLSEHNGEPTIHFITRLTLGKKAISKAGTSADDEIDFVEKAVIGMALRANRDVQNVKETRYYRQCRIPGLMGPTGSGRLSNGATSLRKSLKLSRI